MDPRIAASRGQEKRIARELGGTRTPGSGNGWAVKNDVRTPGWSIECKTTTKASYTLRDKTLKAAETNALLDHREMAFAIDMCGRTWIVISAENFAELRGEE